MSEKKVKCSRCGALTKHRQLCDQYPPPRDLVMLLIETPMLMSDYEREFLRAGSRYFIYTRYNLGLAILEQENPQLLARWHSWRVDETNKRRLKGQRNSGRYGVNAKYCACCEAKLSSKRLLKAAGVYGDYCGWCVAELRYKAVCSGDVPEDMPLAEFAEVLAKSGTVAAMQKRREWVSKAAGKESKHRPGAKAIAGQNVPAFA
jgi:hypothetical protein